MEIQLENGYVLKNTFWDDFCVADVFGESAIQDTFNRAFKEWKNNYTRINADMDRYNRQASNILNESKKQYDYELFDLDDKVQLIKKVIKKIIVERGEKKELYIYIYNNYNDTVETIKLIRNWRNWVIYKDEERPLDDLQIMVRFIRKKY